MAKDGIGFNHFNRSGKLSTFPLRQVDIGSAIIYNKNSQIDELIVILSLIWNVINNSIF